MTDSMAKLSTGNAPPPIKLNIVFMSLGSRGDLQPHLLIAQTLQRRYGHRIRFVVFDTYRQAVEVAGLEFYSAGDVDPIKMQMRRLVSRQDFVKYHMADTRREFHTMGDRYWAACLDDPKGIPREDGAPPPAPFVADAIISIMTPMVHSWIASRIGIPLHMLGTNPRSPSKYLPHSQAPEFASGDSILKNKLSWWLSEFKLLQFGFRDEYADLRINRYGLGDFSPLWYISQWNRLRVPFTNIWSPSLVPSPPDWDEHINIAGFVFPEEDPSYEPPQDLVRFLEAGGEKEAGLYVGFGTSPLATPTANTLFETILDATTRANVRVILSPGPSGVDLQVLSACVEKKGRDNAIVIGDVPHNWLFPRVSAVVTHGGAGTTAMALRSSRPTIVCPVQGDQAFWGHRVWRAGCGPEPLPLKDITAERFAARITEALKPQYAAAAATMASKFRQEEAGEEVFARRVQNTFGIYEKQGRCHVLPDRPAVWKVASHKSSGGAAKQLSAVAAHILVREERLTQVDLEPIWIVKIPDMTTPGDPLSGLVLGIAKVVSNIMGDASKARRAIMAMMSGRGTSQRGGEELASASTTTGHNIGSDQDYSTASAPRNAASPPPLLALLFLVLRVLRAPITLLYHVLFGLYNLLDFVMYELGSGFQSDLFASNLHQHTLTQMLTLLATRPANEIAGCTMAGRSRPNLLLFFPLTFLISILNVVVGVPALMLRPLELQLCRMMGEKPGQQTGDKVTEARIRYGRREAERLDASLGPQATHNVVRIWDEMTANDTGK